MFAFRGGESQAEVAFTDRHGGVSGGPFASLNLADAGGDRPDAVAENRRLVVEAFTRGSGEAEPVVARMRQVHGATVCVVDRERLRSARPEPSAVEGDALAARQAGIVLMVRVADCVPVLLADPAAEVVAVAHAGRRGLVRGVVPAALAAMRDLGASRIVGWVGPHVCGGCYEVPAELRDEVCGEVPQAYAETTWGTPALDLGAGVRAQLEAADVTVRDVSRCTIEDPDLYSHRRQGDRSGRLGGLVWLRP